MSGACILAASGVHSMLQYLGMSEGKHISFSVLNAAIWLQPKLSMTQLVTALMHTSANCSPPEKDRQRGCCCFAASQALWWHRCPILADAP